MHLRLLVITSVFASLLTLSAQDPVVREREILYKNIDLYKNGKYEKAVQNFALMIDRLPDSPFITTNYLMKAKSEYKNQQYMVSLESAKSFIEKFPRSRYQDEIYNLIGNNYYKLDRYSTAITAWEKGVDLTTNAELMEKLAHLISATTRYKLTPGEINDLRKSDPSSDNQLLLAMGEAMKLSDAGSKFQSQKVLENALSENPGSRFVYMAKRLLESGQPAVNSDVNIALLLPLSGFNAEIGEAIHLGAEFAVREYNQTAAHPVKLIIKDYGEDIITAIRFYRELARNPEVMAILGPLENDISSACAAVSDYEKLPIFSPMATNDDLTALSDCFFQLNSTMKMRAQFLADYAVDSLRLKRFATFSPVENQFAGMVDKFIESLKGDSTKVIAQEWYYPSDQDLHQQFMNIKRIGLWYAFADSIISTDPLADSLTIDSLYHVYLEEETERIKETGVKVDSADIAVSSIDAIFLPIYREDIKFIAPQIAYSNIQAQYLGNGDWYNIEELKKNKNYINGIIFVSDGFLDDENWDFRNFRNKYRVAMNTTPTSYNLIGYDCLRYMLRPFDKDNIVLSRADFMAKIKSGGPFEGLYRNIKLDNRNRNVLLQLLRFDYGQIIPLN